MCLGIRCSSPGPAAGLHLIFADPWSKGWGQPQIFLHFSGSNLMMWQRILPNFQDHYHLILVDLRGHGKSDRPDTGYHMDEMARDVIEVMQHLKIERAHIVGSSIGAEVGLSLAANYPEKVISLVLDGALNSEYGPYGTWEGSETEFEEHVASQLEKIQNAPDPIYLSLDALVDGRRELFKKYGWWNAYLEMVVRYDAYQVGEGEYSRGMGKRATENYMRNYFHYRFEDYYRKVKCPLLMLAEKDSEDEREKTAIKGLGELAEQSEIVEISGWAHPYMWFLDPEEACKAILKFLGNITYQKNGANLKEYCKLTHHEADRATARANRRDFSRMATSKAAPGSSTPGCL